MSASLDSADRSGSATIRESVDNSRTESVKDTIVRPLHGGPSIQFSQLQRTNAQIVVNVFKVLN